MAFDFKKEYKDLYRPGTDPSIVSVPSLNYCAVRGMGDPNTEGGAYMEAVSLLYGVSYALKMSKKSSYQIAGYFDFVVPPLEGLWWRDDGKEVDLAHKEDFQWIAMIRLPDFISKEDLQWAIREASKKKKTDHSKVEFFTYEEGLCVQCLHVGPYDDEPAIVRKMDGYLKENGYVNDFGTRRHHEIYLGDPCKTAPDKLKTIIRHPISPES